MKKPQNKNNFTFYFMITAVLMVVVMVISMVVFRFYRQRYIEKGQTAVYDKYFVLITEDRKSAPWQAFYQGAAEEALGNGAYVEFLGNNLADNYSKQELMEIAIHSGADGIMIDADESGETGRLIDEAVEKGIPVVTVNGDNPQSDRICYIGPGNYNLGREYGKQILRYLEGQEGADKEKETALVEILASDNITTSSLTLLCSGIQDYITENNQGQTVAMNIMTVDSNNTFAVEASIRELFIKEPLPDIIVCLNEQNTTSVYQEVVYFNKVGKTGILGYYDSEYIMQAIRRNVITATAAVDMEQMGKAGVDALLEYLKYGNTSQYVAPDITMIDQSNVEKYMGGKANEEN